MHLQFAGTLSHLRHEKGVSQRQVARELGVSQALLSHYENGIREPGLAFVVRACDYYDVSADYLLGRHARQSEQPSLGDAGREESPEMTADLLSRASRALCRQIPELQPLFLQWAEQMTIEGGRNG